MWQTPDNHIHDMLTLENPSNPRNMAGLDENTSAKTLTHCQELASTLHVLGLGRDIHVLGNTPTPLCGKP